MSSWARIEPFICCMMYGERMISSNEVGSWNMAEMSQFYVWLGLDPGKYLTKNEKQPKIYGRGKEHCNLKVSGCSDESGI